VRGACGTPDEICHYFALLTTCIQYALFARRCVHQVSCARSGRSSTAVAHSRKRKAIPQNGTCCPALSPCGGVLCGSLLPARDAHMTCRQMSRHINTTRAVIGLMVLPITLRTAFGPGCRSPQRSSVYHKRVTTLHQSLLSRWGWLLEGIPPVPCWTSAVVGVALALSGTRTVTAGPTPVC